MFLCVTAIVAYIGFGSNLGNLWSNFEEARRQIQNTPGVFALESSRTYHAEPLTLTGETQPWYLNAAFGIRTELSLHALFTELRHIEKKMGRTRHKKWGARVVDLDILFYDQVIYRDKDLCVPHREICRRPFVLLPLCDLAPDFVHPEMQMSLAEILSSCTSPLAVLPFEQQSTGTGG